MRSVVVIRAETGRGLRMRTEGHHLAVRQTAPGTVHLVGTAAGPLGGDAVEIHLHVGSGARLTVLSAAATIVLPHRERPDSTWRVTAVVADGGTLSFAPEPTVVCGGAEHEASTALDLRGDAAVHLVETVVLGRSGEPGGTWTGRMRADRDSSPLLRQTTRSAWLVADGRRTLVTSLDAPSDGEAATHGDAVAMPLAGDGRAGGGLLVTATGTDVSSARRDHAAVRLAGVATR